MYVFFSNYLNHHQLPFCLAMDKLTNHEFYFVATMPTPLFRLRLGYEEMNDLYPFVIRAYLNEKEDEKAIELARDCNIAIVGSAPRKYLEIRMKHNLLTFRYSERILKDGIAKAFNPKYFAGVMYYHTRYLFKPLYMLCASAYTKSDFRIFGAYLKHCYKWGYFPKNNKYEKIDKFIMDKQPKTILWVGRFIDFKHPESVISIAERLKKEKIDCTITMIGDGELRGQIEEQIKEKKLSDYVQVLGAMSPNQVRWYMEQYSIFIFTSDSREGWGVVLNEAMNSACAVIASKKIGSVPFLISDEENGLYFEDGDWNDLYKKITRLLAAPDCCYSLGKNAYLTIMNAWNAEAASERFINVSNGLLNNKKIYYKDGPCSRA